MRIWIVQVNLMERNKPKFGLVQMFWGDGKGKTTAAIGMAFRAVGRGFKVHMVQFMKCGIEGTEEFEEYGELKIIKQFPNFTFERYGVKEWGIGKPKKEHIDAAYEALKAAGNALGSGKYDMVILDEVLYAITMGLLKVGDVVKAVKAKAKNTEAVLTGSHKRVPELEEIADLVTNVKMVKHPYQKGIVARIGTEF